jgi:predicted nucleic acid-binding protein
LARLILDSGAVIALADRDSRVRAFVLRATRNRDLIVVPAVVLAETTRGGPRDAPVNQVLKDIDEIAPATEKTGRMAGRLLATSGMSDATVDALIAAEAVLGGPAVVLTGDQDDFSALLGQHQHVLIHGV